jgi:sugar phosphate permease
MTTTTAAMARQRSFADVWLISLGHAFTHWYPATFYLLLPLIGNELGLSYAQIGSILTVQFVAGAISNVPGGLFVDGFGRKGVLMAVSLAWVGIPYLFMGLSHTYWLLLVCSALVGIGNNLWHPTAIPLLGNRFPTRRGLVMAFHGMAANVGDALAPLAAGALLAMASWRNVVVMNVVPGMIMALLLFAYFGRPQPGDELSPHQRATGSLAGALRVCATLLANRTVTMLSIGGAFRSLTQMSLLTFLPVYLADELGYPALWIGGCMFALQAAGFAAAPIAGYLSDRMGRQQIILSTMGMSAVVFLFMALAGHSPAFVFFVAVLGFFLFATRTVLQAWLLDATPSGMGGTSVGFLFGLQALGAAIGPFLTGMVADHYGLSATFYFLAVTIVVANVFMFVTPMPERQEHNDAVASSEMM